jgi:peptidoglycan/LPS O-acetylase OafA/YrhL
VQHLQTKIYFPGLNGLRFIAAFLVLIGHIESTKYFFGYENRMGIPFYTGIASLSVTLFFVLSGFLITYLLLHEKEHMGLIDIRKFYMKRVLRIWPLYFLIVVAALFIINKMSFFYFPKFSEHVFDDFGAKLFLFLIILPNIASAMFSNVPYLNHTWSIGVEEQFYLIWPWIIKFIHNYLKVFLIIIVAFVVISASLRFISTHLNEITNNPTFFKSIKDLNSYFSMLRMSSMAIGGIAAWLLYYKKEKLLKLIFRKDVQWVNLILLAILLLTNPAIRMIKHEFYSLLFCILIINLASNPKSILRLENRGLNFLGKISYGIYMYHPIAIVISIGVLRQFDNNIFGTILSDLILYLMTLGITIAISIVSYFLFEKIFLRIKEGLPNNSIFPQRA